MGDGKVVMSLGGRLGNMMFTMAAGTYYARKNDKECYFYFRQEETSRYLYDTYDILHLYPEYKGSVSNMVKFSHTKDFTYKELPFVNGDVYFDGCFETEKYFNEEGFVESLYPCSEETKEKIYDQFPGIDDCVGISIRRGDYLNNLNVFLIPEISWYADMYHKYFEGRKAIVFSDDIDWCKNNLEKNENFVFYDNHHSGRDIYKITDPMKNIYTMAFCKDHVCSHSTWSWWGARLCEKKDAVNVFPDKRFTRRHGLTWNDYIPERWISEKAVYINDDWR